MFAFIVIVVVFVLVADIMVCNTHTFRREVSQCLLCDRGQKMQLHSSRQFAILIRYDVSPSLSLLLSFVLSFLLSETFCSCFAGKVCIFESCHVLPRYIHDTRGIGLFCSLYEWNDGIKTSKNSKQNSWSLFLWQKISISFVIICPCHLP